MKKKLLIIGFATNQTAEALTVFLRSARAAYRPDQADIKLVVNRSAGLEGLFEETQSDLLITSNNWTKNRRLPHRLLSRLALRSALWSQKVCSPGGSGRDVFRRLNFKAIERFHHPHVARWFAFDRLLGNLNEYSGLICSDVKDVVFQDSISSIIETGDVHFFSDGWPDFREGTNRDWYLSAYGEDELALVSDKTPICAGFVAGSFAEMKAFIADFAQFMSDFPYRSSDQIALNHFYYSGRMKRRGTVHQNFEDGVATISGPASVRDAIYVSKNEILRHGQGKKLSVVHMYDRLPHVNSMIRHIYGLE